MRRTFTGESTFYSAITRFFDLIFLGVLWLICCIPVFTIGAATTALYYTVCKCVRHERGGLTSSFFGCFRSNFRQATLLTLICLGYAVLGLADFLALRAIGVSADSSPTLYYLSYLYFAPLAVTLPWLFAFVSRFQNTVGGTLKFVWVLLIRNFGATLLLLLTMAAFGLIVYLIPLLLPLLPGPFCLLQSLVIEPVFRPLTRDSDAADPWYNE